MNDDTLTGELRSLGATLQVPAPDPDATAASVLERIADEPAPATAQRRPLMRHAGARVAAAALALLVALALTPPVRATVAEWFGFGGVVVRPGPAESSAPAPPEADTDLTLRTARELVGFDPVVPEGLGAPDGAQVSDDRRLLTLTWNDGDATVRLDEFDGPLAPRFMKTAVIEESAQFVDIAGAQALWFAKPHALVLLDENGQPRDASARTAGPTLVWQVDGVTLRLEGLDRRQAVAVAEKSVTGTG
ncbi:hypothetical protein CLV30_102128 [Haloactinopolyspora alba]|uniref:DUF4367 domain-containing protein n=1 Tax=Haloactinopolyspora alba TaxID=648780 RepID=A0A2P8EB96_9ACTN|nr:hypothetical protein [Haloactinopolyspora alba]PSL06742.1 hypothetical protein CLV30_102128 [Haloactinopolyspora alba]